MVQKFFKQKRQANNSNPPTGKRKRYLIIFGGVIASLIFIVYAGNIVEQSRLERDNVPIVISEVEDNITLDYHTNKYEISAKISGVSLLAEVKVANDRTSIYENRELAGKITYEIKDIKEGDSEVTISVIDGRRHSDKIIKLHRQTKADYDAQELEKAFRRAEESVKNAEQQPTDESISRAKSEIDKLPNGSRVILSERVAKLEKVKQEEKERVEKAKQEAEDKKKQEAAEAARPQQVRPQSNSVATPAPTGLHFRNCEEARAAGYSHIHRGEPGYAPHLDRDGDGIACDKHR